MLPLFRYLVEVKGLCPEIASEVIIRYEYHMPLSVDFVLMINDYYKEIRYARGV